MSFPYLSIHLRVRDRPVRVPAPPIGWCTAIVVLLAVGSICTAQTRPQFISVRKEQPVGGAAADSRRLVGVGSCTAAGCHGGAQANRVVGSEYNIWIAQDPHARAYSILFEERSERMIRLLDNLKEGQPSAAYNDARCLACHSMTDAPPRGAIRDVVSDGVSCEACHGPASGWLSRHYEHPLDAGGRRDLGMKETKDLLVRTQICTSCHVGSPADSSQPRRDVNHDLIAAGHPRLQFEMSAYLQAMPKHWDEAKDRAKWGEDGGDFDALVWAIGQAATSQAAAKQLANRAGTNNKKNAWPEFSEWSCSTCHHDLRDDANRQKNLAAGNALSGQLVDWDAWNHFATRTHAADICKAFGVEPNVGDRVQAEMQQLGEEMRKLNPDRQRVAALAERASITLNDFASAIGKSRATPHVNLLTRSILEEKNLRGLIDWSRAAQTYDALASLHETRLRQNHKPPQQAANALITKVMQQLYGNLASPTPSSRNNEFRRDEVLRQFSELSKLAPAPEVNR